VKFLYEREIGKEYEYVDKEENKDDQTPGQDDGKK